MMPIIDKILSFTISKKLTVFIIATFYLYFDKIDSEQWIMLSAIYIGGQTIIDVILKLKSK
jgi:hypothetical protein